jgi:predicted nucleotidyltransferase
MAQNQVKPNIITIAQQFKQALQQSPYKIEQVILFGSHVHGTAKPWSDIDIGVVSPDLTGLHLDDFPKLRRISEPITLDIEPHGLTPEQFKSPEHSLSAEMKKTGIVI